MAEYGDNLLINPDASQALSVGWTAYENVEIIDAEYAGKAFRLNSPAYLEQNISLAAFGEVTKGFQLSCYAQFNNSSAAIYAEIVLYLKISITTVDSVKAYFLPCHIMLKNGITAWSFFQAEFSETISDITSVTLKIYTTDQRVTVDIDNINLATRPDTGVELTSAIAAVQTTADGKNTVYYSSTMPTGGTYRVNDIWFDTDDGNKMYLYDGSAWEPVQFGSSAILDNAIDADKLADEINQAILNAQNTADEALENANFAQTTADGKNTVYYQITAPTGGTYKVNDIWYDTDDGQKMHYWNGTAWISVPFGTNAIGNDAITADKLADAINQAIYDAQSTASTALTSANGKNKVYYQTAQPSGGTYILGDIWFDTDDGYKMYVHNGTAFTASQFGTNAIANLAITNALIADATITSAKISAVDAGKITTGTLNADRIAANSITASKLVAGTITATSGVIANAAIVNAMIADAAINNAKIANVDAGKITTGTLSADRIAANSITAEKMVAGTITAASGILADAVIGTTKIADLAVVEAKIADLSVTNMKIADLAITNAKIADAAINNAKISNVDAGKITTGILDASLVNIKTGTGTSRVEIVGTGINGYLSNVLRVQLEYDRLEFHRAGSAIGNIRTEYVDQYWGGSVLGDCLFIESAGNAIAFNAASGSTAPSLVVMPGVAEAPTFAADVINIGQTDPRKWSISTDSTDSTLNITQVAGLQLSLTSTGLTINGDTRIGNAGSAKKQYSWGGLYTGSTTNTGTIRVSLGTGNVMFNARITIWSYYYTAELIAGGYTYIDSGAWYNPRVTGRVHGGTLNVRFSSSGSNRYIQIGDTTTNWGGYLHVTVDDVSSGYGIFLSPFTVSLATAYIGTTNATQNIGVVWHTGNDGSGSGLDADLLDGNHASAFLKLSGGTMTGDLNMGSNDIVGSTSDCWITARRIGLGVAANSTYTVDASSGYIRAGRYYAGSSAGVTDNIKFYDSDSGGYYTLVFTGGIVTFCGWSTS